MFRESILPLAIAFACAATAVAEPVFDTDALSDDELRKYRKERVAELQRRAREGGAEKTPEGKAYRIFFCTLYYTPKESGFTAERGFDAAPITAPG
jgi:hypothetical protein